MASSSDTSVAMPELKTTAPISKCKTTPILSHLPAGYPMLAQRRGDLPEMAMFRRFGAPNARNLLYFQSELLDLEKKLEELEAADSKTTKDGLAMKYRYARNYARNYFWLRTASQTRDGNTEQRDLVERIRVVLHQYSECSLRLWKTRY
jgi:hypothetical protein